MRSDLSPLFDCARITVKKSHGVRKVVGNALVRRAHLLANDRGANVFDETSGRALSLLLLPISRKTS